MSEKYVNTRIINKHDTEANWNNSKIIPKQGELIIYDTDGTYNYERFKIGDGSKTPSQLPFVTDKIDKIAVTETTPAPSTKYYPLYASGKSGNQEVRANADLYYYGGGTWSSLNVGDQKKGILTLHDGKGHIVDISSSDLSANRAITIPDVGGTLALTSNIPTKTSDLTNDSGFITDISTTTADAAPHTHTHNVTVSGTTGSNSGSAVNAVTGYGSFSGGGGSLTSNDTSSNGIKYVEDVTHTAASLTGTKTFNTDAIKSISLSASTTSTDGPAYVESVTHTAASLTGDTTFVKTQGTFNAGTTPVSSAAPAHTSINSGTNSGTAITALTGVRVSSSSSAAPGGHTHTVTVSGTTGNNSGSAVSAVNASYDSGVLTLSTVTAAPNTHTHSYGSSTALTTSENSGTNFNAATAVAANGTASVAPNEHTHAYDKTTGIDLQRGTAPSLGAATSGTVGISGGSITPVTKYMKATGTAAATGTVGISGGSTSATTKYLHHTHTGASLGSPSTSSVAPSEHTHSYGSSTALTTGNNSGSAIAAVTGVVESTD